MNAVKTDVEVIQQIISEDEHFPGNSRLPLTIYRNVIEFGNKDRARLIESIFDSNKWKSSWRDSIYRFHHYHSNTHESLGIYRGHANVQFGGPNGPVFKVQTGDIILIPAGVAHKNLDSSDDFGVVGAYPNGKSWDMNYGKEDERPDADKNINEVPVPELDPVFGQNKNYLNLREVTYNK